MGNKQQKLETPKSSLQLPKSSPHSANESFSQTPKSTTPMSTRTIMPLSFPNIPNAYSEQLPSQTPKAISIASRTSFSKGKKSSIIYTNTDQHLNINNGVTGLYLSVRIAKIASDFWKQNIEAMPGADKLEIGAAIFFAMLSNTEMKDIIQSNIKQQTNLKSVSIKYLEMMGWLTHNLLRNDIDLYSILTQLGAMHIQMGVNIKHFHPMLEAIHEVFPYYFPKTYNIKVKYAIDEIFTLAAQIMTAQNIKCCSHLNDIAQSFGANDIAFLKDLNICLSDTVGRKYLYRYLRQTMCEELAIFLQSLNRFKNQTCAKSRLMVARSIHKISIQPASDLAINISYECRENILCEMRKLEQRFTTKQELFISSDFFDQCEMEVKRLIRENHWRKFVNSIKKLQLNSLE